MIAVLLERAAVLAGELAELVEAADVELGMIDLDHLGHEEDEAERAREAAGAIDLFRVLLAMQRRLAAVTASV